MLHFSRFLSAIAAVALVTTASTQAADSLYSFNGSRRLTPTEAKMFGPEAGKFRYDSRMLNAAKIAQSRARSRSTAKCWRYVKQALLAAGVVDSYPKTVYAKQAAGELTKSYGFKRLKMRDPNHAPLGSVLVYGGRDAGHIEIRTTRGYVSDFVSKRPYSRRPLLGIFVKPHA